MPNNKENARINKKSDMVIGMEDYVMMKEWMRYLINWFKDKWIVKNMIECLMNWWVNDTKENLMLGFSIQILFSRKHCTPCYFTQS